MGEPVDRATYPALMHAQDWGALTRDLLLHAKRKRISEDLAEQLVADATVRVCDPKRSPWRPDEHGSLLTHLQWAFRSELEHYFAKRKRQKTYAAGDDLPEPPPDSDQNPEVRNERQANLRDLRDRLYAAFANRPLPLKLLTLEDEEHITEVDEQVARSGATRAQVYEARRALAIAARELLKGSEHHLSRERAAALRDAKKNEADE